MDRTRSQEWFPFCRSGTSSCGGKNRKKFWTYWYETGWRINEPANQVVIVRLGDAHAPNLAYSRRLVAEIIDVADSIDLGSLSGHARLPQQVGFFGRPFYQNVHFLADHFAIPCLRNAALQGHQFALSVVDGARIHLRVQVKAGAGLFIGIREDAHPV